MRCIMKTNVTLQEWLWHHVPVEVYPLGRSVKTRNYGGKMLFDSLTEALFELEEACGDNYVCDGVLMQEKGDFRDWNRVSFPGNSLNICKVESVYQCVADDHDYDVWQFLNAFEDGEYIFGIKYSGLMLELVFDTSHANATVNLQYTYFDKEEQS